ncbi:MAG: endolytic transglycosylase MltG, partial [Caldimicrobium sp.]
MKFSRDKKFIVLLLIIFHLFLFLGLYLEGLEPVSSTKLNVPKIIEINKGENILSIAQKLKTQGLIKNRLVFIIEALRKGAYKEFKAGEYALYPHQRLDEIFEILTKGKVYLHKVTIIEGATLWEIAEVLEKNFICSKKEFLQLAENEEFVKNLGFPGPTIEGYLYPETYFFPKNT